MSNVSTATSERALKLLGQGIPAEQVAGACGVTVSAISQLMSQEEFSKKVLEARFESLSKHNEVDNEYDDMERKLQVQFKGMMEWGLTKPLEVLKAMQVINKMDRRGQAAPQHITNQQTVVHLVMPVQIVQQFRKNATNQVVQAGTQDLITIQSGQMGALLKESNHVPNANPLLIEAAPSA